MLRKVSRMARKLIENKEDFVMATLMETVGSTPGKKGARLLIQKDGTGTGTVGGGKLEAEVQRLALELFDTKESRTVHFTLTDRDQTGLDMRCGGDAVILLSYIDTEKPETFQDDFIDNTKAYIFGAGHVGLALEPVLRHVGFDTIVLDDRAEFANRERFPQATEIKVFSDFESAYEGLETDENSYIVIITRGHQGDYDVLKQALKNPAAYIGMMGSRAKVAGAMKMLEEEGFSPEERAGIYTPIGLSIGAETPEEIAVSIAAEMIEVRAGHGK